MAMGALLSCSVVAGSAWGLASTLGAMHGAARTLSEGRLDIMVAVASAPGPQSAPLAIKSSRFKRLSEHDVRGHQLTDDAIRVAHQRTLAAQLALAEKQKREESARLLAMSAPRISPAQAEEKTDEKPAVVTALVEDVPVKDMEPFNLVMASPEEEETFALPSEVPLPETKPQIGKATADRKASDEKPVLGKRSTARQELAYAKPERSIFGGLFSRKNDDALWPGNDTRVAIYDVSNATVYMPDGTKLRAHSGIGHMRDNPRYEHVKMNGPTPAGIYRLSMREKRFYGVEAIRMTSIDGRDPKNRTGLLTHTNLLRGRIGSHGCVAFQNYEPFLRAFKRGEVKMLVVVPELPSSRTQLAALYRKAGA